MHEQFNIHINIKIKMYILLTKYLIVLLAEWMRIAQ